MEHDPTEDSRVKQALFVSSWKRDYAAERHVNVYSSNAVLQEQLNKVSWAAAIGGIGVSGALTAAGGAAAIAVSNTRLANQVTEALKEEPPSRLRIINEEKLLAMGLSENLTERFLDHPHFSPRHDTVITDSLADLRGARGRDAFLAAILEAQDAVAATFFMNTAQTLRAYNETMSPIEDIATVSHLVVALAGNGRALIPFPLDHGVWSKRANEVIDLMKADYEKQGFRGRYDLWVTGTVSWRAKEEFARRGISVTENVDQKMGFLD